VRTHSLYVPVLCFVFSLMMVQRNRNMSPNFWYWLPVYVVFIDWINYYKVAESKFDLSLIYVMLTAWSGSSPVRLFTVLPKALSLEIMQASIRLSPICCFFEAELKRRTYNVALLKLYLFLNMESIFHSSVFCVSFLEGGLFELFIFFNPFVTAVYVRALCSSWQIPPYALPFALKYN